MTLPATRHGLSLFELDRVLMTRTLQYLFNAISTLRSTGRLLHDIVNMVVLDKIKYQVDASLGLVYEVRLSP